MKAERVQHNHCSLPVSSILLTGLTIDQPNTDNMSTINVPTANSTIADVDGIVFHHLCRLDADCTNDVVEDLLSESRDAMLNEAVERCCQEMIARGEYTSHPNFVLPKHEGPNATEMMANDIVKLYLYTSKQIDDFPNLNPPSSVTENVNQYRINVGPLLIKKQTNESCDVNKLINSICNTNCWYIIT